MKNEKPGVFKESTGFIVPRYSKFVLVEPKIHVGTSRDLSLHKAKKCYCIFYLNKVIHFKLNGMCKSFESDVVFHFVCDEFFEHYRCENSTFE